MPHKLTPETLHELTIVTAKGPDGRDWAPRNPEARLLATKSAAKGPDKRFAAKVLDAVKGAMGYPVSVDVPDKIDNDGDGADDYNAICQLFSTTFSDFQSACCIGDDAARSAAVCAVIDGFLDQLDDLRGNDDDGEKAGARHSAADKASIDGINEAQGRLKKSLDAAQKAHSSIVDNLQNLGSGDKPSDEAADDDDGGDEMGKAKPATSKADKEPYGDVEYADPGYQDDKQKRYRIDTKEHAKAAWSYINKESNASKYSADDLAKVKAKIKAACEKFGIEISDDSKAAPAEEIDMTKEEVQAMIDAAVATKAAESKAEIEAANARADAAEVSAKKASDDAEAAKAAQTASEKSSVKLARSVSAISSEKSGEDFAVARKSRMTNLVQEALGRAPEPTRL